MFIRSFVVCEETGSLLLLLFCEAAAAAVKKKKKGVEVTAAAVAAADDAAAPALTWEKPGERGAVSLSVETPVSCRCRKTPQSCATKKKNSRRDKRRDRDSVHHPSPRFVELISKET